MLNDSKLAVPQEPEQSWSEKGEQEEIPGELCREEDTMENTSPWRSFSLFVKFDCKFKDNCNRVSLSEIQRIMNAVPQKSHMASRSTWCHVKPLQYLLFFECISSSFGAFSLDIMAVPICAGKSQPLRHQMEKAAMPRSWCFDGATLKNGMVIVTCHNVDRSNRYVFFLSRVPFCVS